MLAEAPACGDDDGDDEQTAGDGAKVHDAKVIAADIATTNGVIHEIDTVLMPPG